MIRKILILVLLIVFTGCNSINIAKDNEAGSAENVYDEWGLEDEIEQGVKEKCLTEAKNLEAGCKEELIGNMSIEELIKCDWLKNSRDSFLSECEDINNYYSVL